MSDDNERKWMDERALAVLDKVQGFNDSPREYYDYVVAQRPLLTPRAKAVLEAVEKAIVMMDKLDSNQDEDPEAVCKDAELRASILWKALSPIRKAYKETP